MNSLSPSSIFVLCALAAGAVAVEDPVDTNPDPHVFQSDSLPNEKERPSVANGEVATVVYTDTVYLNGLYNGDHGDSHRARIPSRINIRLATTQTITQHDYRLDTDKGTFIERVVIEGVVVEQRTFAHRSLTPLLVTQITADFSQSAWNSLKLNLTDDPGTGSEDITFSGPFNYTHGPGKEQNGQTMVPEDPMYQKGASLVTVIYSEVPETILLTKVESIVTFVMSISSNYSETSEAYLKAINMPGEELYQSHVEKWASIWASGNIMLDGSNLQLAKVVRGCMYYLLSSLPNEPVDGQRRRFSGLSPGSLANGALSRDYQGHSFWDTETWMYPPVLMLWSYVAKDLLLYRMRNIQAARDRAVATGFQGARFPWESAFTGVEVTPDCCPETRDNQQHITGDISFAARQYWAATGDRQWLTGEDYDFDVDINGCDFIREMAHFWASRAEFNPRTGQYEINGVMPPDEDHSYVNNSVYTNVLAAYSIFFAKHAECECGEWMTGGSIPDDWLTIARQMKIPFDENEQFHPEFDGYPIGETIKQADVVLLGFPIMFVKDAEIRRNDLEMYEKVTRDTGPAMTWSMHAIGHLELGDEVRAEQLLNRSFQPYLVEPFKVWNEAMNHRGAFNFITGMGGFLQSILFGYGGFRLTVEHLEGNPTLPPGIDKFVIHGLDYLGCSFDMVIQSTTIDVESTGPGCIDLVLFGGNPEVSESAFKLGAGKLVIARSYFMIVRNTPLSCPLPEDKPGQSGEINGSHHILSFPSLLLLFVLALLVLA